MLRLRFLTGEDALSVLLQELLHAEEEEHDGAQTVADRLHPDIGDDRARGRTADQRARDALRHGRRSDHDGTVDGHHESVAAEPALCFDMVERICDHRKDHVSRGRGTQALQGDADGSDDHIVIEDARKHAAQDAQDHADDDDETLAELVAERGDKDDGDRHRQGADDAENTRDGIFRERLRLQKFRVEVERSVLDAAAELIEEVEDQDRPEECVGDGRFRLSARAHRALFLRSRLHPLLGHAFAREVVLEHRPEEGDHRHDDKEDHPERLLRPEAHLGLHEDAEQEGEDHRARAHRAEERHIDKGCKDAPLIGVARRERSQGAVRRIVQREGDGIVEIVGDDEPHHLCRGAFKGLDKDEHAGKGEQNGGEQDPRPRFSRTRARALHELPRNEIARHDENGGEDGKEHQKALDRPFKRRTGGKLLCKEHVAEVPHEIGREDAVREHGAERTDQVPEERFHGFDIRRAHPRPQERTVKYTFVLPLFHHLSSPTYVFRILLPTPQALMNVMRISARKDRLSPKRIFVKVSQVLISL